MPYIVLVYGLLIFMGGIMGHAKAGSQASLVMGATFGVLLLIAAGACFQKNTLKNPLFLPSF